MANLEVQLPDAFSIEPERLIIARQKLPLDDEDYVPFMVINPSVSMVEPTLTSLGDGAVAMSIGRPFGFMQGPIIQETQKTDGIILAPDPTERYKWLATFDTPKPLSGLDLSIFSFGISQYVTHAKTKLGRS